MLYRFTLLTGLSWSGLSRFPQRKHSDPVVWSDIVSPPEEHPALIRLSLAYRQQFPSGFEPSASREQQSLSLPPHLRLLVSPDEVELKLPASQFPPSSHVSQLVHHLHLSRGRAARPADCPPSCSTLSLQSGSSSRFLSKPAQGCSSALGQSPAVWVRSRHRFLAVRGVPRWVSG